MKMALFCVIETSLLSFEFMLGGVYEDIITYFYVSNIYDISIRVKEGGRRSEGRDKEGELKS